MDPLEFLETITHDVASVQQKVLEEILSANAQTEYLSNFNLDGATHCQIFKSKVPVVGYEDIHPLIKRIANGDPSPILCCHPIKEFFTSSGTSGGQRKLIPAIDGEIRGKETAIIISIHKAIMKQSVPRFEEGKGMYFEFAKSESMTAGGLVARPVLTSLYKSDWFKQQSLRYSTSPVEAVLCLDAFQSMYAQMLAGLYQRDQVFRMGAAFASGFLRAIRFLQMHWQQLADDIRIGMLNPRITDPSVRACMTRGIMKPDPLLADFITKECSTENWGGIIQRIWPKAIYLETIVTGAMAQYASTLDYYTGGIPIVSGLYASSECFIGLNLKPMCDPSHVSYTIMPNMAYFEFLPVEPANGGDATTCSMDPKLVDLANVEMGKEYELVVTTYWGLYRYRVGDILRVTGFYNSAPQFQFLRREGVILSIDEDKTDELEIQVAIKAASELLAAFNIGISEYTSNACTKTIPGHYVIYCELLKKEGASWPTNQLMEKCCMAMENSLSSVYRQCRVALKSIGPLEMRIVSSGTFEELMDYAIARGASITQYKTPRCLSSPQMLELLDSRVVSSHFSTALPQWTP